MKKDLLKGKVLESLPNLEFIVEITGMIKPLRCYTAGKLKMHKIRILVGDEVGVEYTQGHSIGRISKRY